MFIGTNEVICGASETYTICPKISGCGGRLTNLKYEFHGMVPHLKCLHRRKIDATWRTLRQPSKKWWHVKVNKLLSNFEGRAAISVRVDVGFCKLLHCFSCTVPRGF